MNSKRAIIRRAGGGNTLYTTIPPEFCYELRLQRDTVVDIEIINGKIVMTPIAGLAENSIAKKSIEVA